MIFKIKNKPLKNNFGLFFCMKLKADNNLIYNRMTSIYKTNKYISKKPSNSADRNDADIARKKLRGYKGRSFFAKMRRRHKFYQKPKVNRICAIKSLNKFKSKQFIAEIITENKIEKIN